jgi:RNA polymerase sigma-70 factor (ECF subfamily)
MAHLINHHLSPHLTRKPVNLPPARDIPPNDHELLQQIKAGQTQAFAVLYESHKRAVFAICLRMLHDHSLAEDLTQEAFLCAFRRVNSFREDCTFRTWLHSIAVNGVLMHFRSRKTRISAQMSIDELNSNNGGWVQEKVGIEDKQLSSAVDRLTLSDAINQLPPGYKNTFLLLDVQGYTHIEAAKMLGCSTGNTKSQLHKARLKLRRILNAQIQTADAILPNATCKSAA